MLESLSSATRINFSNSLPGFINHPEFDAQTIALIRGEHASKILVVVDRAYNLKKKEPHIVHDHLNLSGNNPLVGPNPSCGQRFPVVNNIYLNALQTLNPKKTLPLKAPFSTLPTVVVAGLKPGIVPSNGDIELMNSLGADCYCYNMVPTMLVAAHAGFKVFGILVPFDQDLDSEMAMNLRGVTY